MAVKLTIVIVICFDLILNFNKDETNLEHAVGPLLVLLLALRGLQILVLRVMLV